LVDKWLLAAVRGCDALNSPKRPAVRPPTEQSARRNGLRWWRDRTDRQRSELV